MAASLGEQIRAISRLAMAMLPKQVDVEKVLRLRPDREVYLARMGGEQVIIRRFPERGPADRVQAMKTELDFLTEMLGEGPSQVARCLMAFPRKGIVVSEFVEGPRADQALLSADAAGRVDLMRRAGAWLDTVAGLRAEPSSFGPRHWLKDLDDRAAAHDAPPATVGALQERLGALAAEASGTPLRRAFVHGDWSPLNAIVSGDRLVGVDIEGPSRMAVARDAARFLVGAQVFAGVEGGAGPLGVAPGDAEAFLSSGVLAEEEAAKVLPFFIGHELARRLLDAPEPAQNAALQAAAGAWLSG